MKIGRHEPGGILTPGRWWPAQRARYVVPLGVAILAGMSWAWGVRGPSAVQYGRHARLGEVERGGDACCVPLVRRLKRRARGNAVEVHYAVANLILGETGRTAEHSFANVALFLCSPLASYVTGQTIEVNGGWRG